MMLLAAPTDVLPQRKRLFHHAPLWVRNSSRFFVTVCCAERDHPQLTQPRVFDVMVDAIEHYVAAQRWWMDLFLAMPDHFHAVASFQHVEDMPAVIRDWKRYVAKQAGIVWQDGFFDHRLRSSESTTEKWNYILLNPVRKGLVPKPEDWRFVWTPPIDPAR